jgi:hypothetical protein
MKWEPIDLYFIKLKDKGLCLLERRNPLELSSIASSPTCSSQETAAFKKLVCIKYATEVRSRIYPTLCGVQNPIDQPWCPQKNGLKRVLESNEHPSSESDGSGNSSLINGKDNSTPTTHTATGAKWMPRNMWVILQGLSPKKDTYLDK